MSDLIYRLLEAIEAREQKAVKAAPGPWRPNAEHDEVYAVDDIPVCEGFALSGNQVRATVDFIAENDPSSVLRRCEADKAAVRWFEAGQARLKRLNDRAASGRITESGQADRAEMGTKMSEAWAYMKFMAIGYGITEEEK